MTVILGPPFLASATVGIAIAATATAAVQSASLG